MTSGDGKYQREGPSRKKVLPTRIPTVIEFGNIRSVLQKEFEVSGSHNPCSPKFPPLQKVRISRDQIISACGYGARKNMIVIRVPAYSGSRLGGYPLIVSYRGLSALRERIFRSRKGKGAASFFGEN